MHIRTFDFDAANYTKDSLCNDIYKSTLLNDAHYTFIHKNTKYLNKNEINSKKQNIILILILYHNNITTIH